MCAPYNGDRGEKFQKVFAKEFKTASMAKYDPDYLNTWVEHLNGTDFGGTDDAGTLTNHPGALGSAERLRSEKMYNVRASESFAMIRRHVTRLDIQTAMDDLPRKRGRDAWKLLTTYGAPHSTGLLTVATENKWTYCRLAHVGISLESMTLLRSKMDELGNEQNPVKTALEKRIKFLTLIVAPSQLREKAANELQRASYYSLLVIQK